MAQLERAEKLYLLGDLSEKDYDGEKAKIELALNQLKPSDQAGVNIEQATQLLNDFGREIDAASPFRRKQFYRTAVLDEVFVQNRKIAAIRPKPGYYDLLCMSAVRPNGDPSPSTIRVLAEYEAFD